MTVCLKCGIEKNDIDFPIDQNRKSGRYPYCCQCKSEEQRGRRKVETEARRRLPKQCRKCGRSEPVAEFPSRLSHNCWDCHEEQASGHRPVRVIEGDQYEKRRSRSKIHRERRKLILVEMLGSKCADCGIEVGEKWPSACFDFHHEGTKEAIIAKLMHSWKSKYGQLLEEIRKCTLLCSNCHRKRHFVGSSCLRESQEGGQDGC